MWRPCSCSRIGSCLALGQTPEVADLASSYLLVAGWSVIPGLLTNLLRAYLSTLGRPSAVLVVTLVGFVSHAALNWMLIFGHAGFAEMGIRGAAVSTLISDSLIFLLLAGFALRVFPEYDLLARFWRPDREMLARIFALGWPIGLQLLAEVGLFTGAAVMMGWVSPEMLAAHGIAMQLASTTFLVHLGLSSAATIRTGAAAGLHDAVLLRDGAVTAVLMSACFALATIALFLSIPEALVGLFLDPANPKTPGVVRAGVTLVTMAALFQLFDGGQAMAIGLLRGVQDTRVPMLLAGFGYWLIGLPVAYSLGFVAGWGGVGVWTGLLVALFIVWLALSWRFWLTPVRQVGISPALT